MKLKLKYLKQGPGSNPNKEPETLHEIFSGRLKFAAVLEAIGY
jgi:hypothetical protein